MKNYPLCLVCLLSACALSPRDTGNANRITLESVKVPSSCSMKNESLIIDYPQVPDALNTYRIALTDYDGRSDTFAGMRWDEFLPDTIQSALVASLNAKPDNSITTIAPHLENDLREFQAVYTKTNAAPEVHIEIMFRLYHSAADKGRSILVKKTIKAAGEDAASITTAFREGFTAVEKDLIKHLCNTKK